MPFVTGNVSYEIFCFNTLEPPLSRLKPSSLRTHGQREQLLHVQRWSYQQRKDLGSPWWEKMWVETKRTIHRSRYAWNACPRTLVASSSGEGLEPDLFHTILKLRVAYLTAHAWRLRTDYGIGAATELWMCTCAATPRPCVVYTQKSVQAE